MGGEDRAMGKFAGGLAAAVIDKASDALKRG